MSFFGFFLTNPIAWTGIFALSIPFVIHLFTRRTPVTLEFPTIRFLKKAKASQSRIFRLRHLLLMLLRTAILAALLMAFLRPVYQAGALAESETGDGNHATIVIVDLSLSMDYSGAGVTPLSRAKVAADRILDYLSPGDLANVIFASAHPTASFDAPETNHYRLHSDIEKATTTLERASMEESIAMAVKQLEPLVEYRREIHIVSDFQRSNWADVAFGILPEEIKVVFVSADEQRKSNHAVTEVHVGPARPTVSESVEIVCRVANYTPKPKSIPLDLHLEGQAHQKKTINVQPGMTATASFRVSFDTPGLLEGRVSIPEDGVSEDDTRYFIVPVTERLRVTLLSDEVPQKSATSHALLQMALNPFADDSGTVQVDVLKPDDFDALAGSRSDVVFLAGVQALSTETALALVEYMRNGGGLTYFLTSSVDKTILQLLVAQSNEDLQLPFNVERWVGKRPDDTMSYAILHQANYDSPLLRKFRESGDLANLSFYRYFTTERVEAQGQILLRYDNNSVALAKKSVGLGTMLIANFSPDLDSSDLAQHTVFVPLVHEMVRATRPQSDAGRSFQVGQACSTSITLDSRETILRFSSPSDTEINASINGDGGEASILFEKSEEVGFYRVQADNHRVGSVAVNVDHRESNLDFLTLPQMEELAAESRAQFFARSGGSAAELLRLREGTPLWPYLIAAMMIGLFIEQMTTLLWKR
jgi:hypothetical protein